MFSAAVIENEVGLNINILYNAAVVLTIKQNKKGRPPEANDLFNICDQQFINR